MKSNKTSIVLTLIAALTVTAAVVGCKDKNASTEMNNAGSDMKDAASKTADAAKDAAVATKDAVTNAVGK
ncbi:MAG TPA: hypothetical protein VH255_02480 [Verrucomicrobiae bacterium]|jgi:hypothetical protein|nr:hypothetical protein [Verrucomicrobiae bacterium]